MGSKLKFTLYDYQNTNIKTLMFESLEVDQKVQCHFFVINSLALGRALIAKQVPFPISK